MEKGFNYSARHAVTDAPDLSTAIRLSTLNCLHHQLGWSVAESEARARVEEERRIPRRLLNRLEARGAVPQRYHLERIAQWGGTTAEWIREGDDAQEEVEPEPAEQDTTDLFGSLDRVVRFLGGIAPPGQEQLRKLDALEGLRRMLTVRAALPAWWYQLRDRIENDEL